MFMMIAFGSKFRTIVREKCLSPNGCEASGRGGGTTSNDWPLIMFGLASARNAHHHCSAWPRPASARNAGGARASTLGDLWKTAVPGVSGAMWAPRAWHIIASQDLGRTGAASGAGGQRRLRCYRDLGGSVTCYRKLALPCRWRHAPKALA